MVRRNALLVVDGMLQRESNVVNVVARDARPFLEVGDYFGPDRRFRSEPWEGLERRSEEIRKAEFEAQRKASIEL